MLHQLQCVGNILMRRRAQLAVLRYWNTEYVFNWRKTSILGAFTLSAKHASCPVRTNAHAKESETKEPWRNVTFGTENYLRYYFRVNSCKYLPFYQGQPGEQTERGKWDGWGQKTSWTEEGELRAVKHLSVTILLEVMGSAVLVILNYFCESRLRITERWVVRRYLLTSHQSLPKDTWETQRMVVLHLSTRPHTHVDGYQSCHFPA